MLDDRRLPLHGVGFDRYPWYQDEIYEKQVKCCAAYSIYTISAVLQKQQNHSFTHSYFNTIPHLIVTCPGCIAQYSDRIGGRMPALGCERVDVGSAD